MSFITGKPSSSGWQIEAFQNASFKAGILSSVTNIVSCFPRVSHCASSRKCLPHTTWKNAVHRWCSVAPGYRHLWPLRGTTRNLCASSANADPAGPAHEADCDPGQGFWALSLQRVSKHTISGSSRTCWIHAKQSHISSLQCQRRGNICFHKTVLKPPLHFPFRLSNPWKTFSCQKWFSLEQNQKYAPQTNNVRDGQLYNHVSLKAPLLQSSQREAPPLTHLRMFSSMDWRLISLRYFKI